MRLRRRPPDAWNLATGCFGEASRLPSLGLSVNEKSSAPLEKKRVGILCVVNHFGIGAGLNVARKIERDTAGSARHVDAAEGQLRRAAQVKAAAGKGESQRENDGVFQNAGLSSRGSVSRIS